MHSAIDPALEVARGGNHKTVYVIDDNIEVRRSLHFLLQTAGFTSRQFSTAFDFLDDLEALRPAPIILDIFLPVMDGFELMRKLSDRQMRWPIIAVTAYGTISAAVQTMKLGACEFLEKPFEFELLEAALQKAFAQLSIECPSASAELQ